MSSLSWNPSRKSVSWKGFLWSVAGCYCFRFVPFCSITSLLIIRDMSMQHLFIYIYIYLISVHFYSCHLLLGERIKFNPPCSFQRSLPWASGPLCQFLIVVLVMFLRSTSRDLPRNFRWQVSARFGRCRGFDEGFLVRPSDTWGGRKIEDCRGSGDAPNDFT